MFIGLDIGGTKVAGVARERDGLVAARRSWPSPTGAYDAAVGRLAHLVEQLAGGRPVEAVGVALAGFLDQDRTQVLQSPNLGWPPAPLLADLSGRLGVPVTLENDGSAAAWAEHCAGDRAVQTLVMFTLGTGVGGGVVCGGELLTGAKGIAGELGHLVVDPGGRTCVCGGRGCLDAYSSGRAFMATVRDRLTEDPAASRALMTACGGDPAALTGADVTRALELDDAVCRDAVQDNARWLARAVQAVCRICDPDQIVVGGGLASLGPPLLRALEHASEPLLALGAVSSRPALRLASLGGWAGAHGAADLAVQRCTNWTAADTRDDQHP